MSLWSNQGARKFGRQGGHKAVGWALLLTLAGGGISLPSAWAAGKSMTLTVSAEVVNQPCTLRPGDETIPVDFGNLNNQVLLKDLRTPGKPFQLHLEGCDPAIASSVKVTFSGQGAAEDTRLLALAGESAAKGIAIGLEQGGQPLPLNQASRGQALAAGSNVLDFAAYVQLLPSGLASLTPGAFNATANFTLDYD